MATAGQTDPRQEVLDHLTAKVTFDAPTLAFLRDRLDEVDPAELQKPARMAEAKRNMDSLVRHLNRPGLRSGPVQIDAMMLSLRDLCPLFPICS